MTLKEFIAIRNEIRAVKPLIHCLTNHITINDCANLILAAGARPIMAEHRKEVEEITASSAALVMNLGNITDERMESMVLSAKTAKREGIPALLDTVGVGCSRLRLDFARDLINVGRISVIKGNISEIKALAGLKSRAVGVDAGKEDSVEGARIGGAVDLARSLADSYNTTVVISGATDIVSDGKRAYLIENGCSMMADVTGTGCMQGALIGALLPAGNPAAAGVLAAVSFGICGELSASAHKGIGSFKLGLFDAMYELNGEQIEEKMKCRLWED